jgi:hypothetical protein
LFVYDANEVNLNIKINVYIRNKSVKEALNKVFKGTDIVYIVESNNIMLKKKVIHKLEFNHVSQSSDQARYSNKISGVVKDAYGQPVIGANVSIVGTVNGTITDSNGKFNLYDHSISGKLLVSYVGYESQEFSIKDKRYFSITLKEKSSNLNEGIEINLNTNLIRTKNFTWLFNVNTTTIKNKILSLPSNKKTTIIDGHGGYTFDLDNIAPQWTLPFLTAEIEGNTAIRNYDNPDPGFTSRWWASSNDILINNYGN